MENMKTFEELLVEKGPLDLWEYTVEHLIDYYRLEYNKNPKNNKKYHLDQIRNTKQYAGLKRLALMFPYQFKNVKAMFMPQHQNFQIDKIVIDLVHQAVNEILAAFHTIHPVHLEYISLAAFISHTEDKTPRNNDEYFHPKLITSGNIDEILYKKNPKCTLHTIYPTVDTDFDFPMWYYMAKFPLSFSKLKKFPSDFVATTKMKAYELEDYLAKATNLFMFLSYSNITTLEKQPVWKIITDQLKADVEFYVPDNNTGIHYSTGVYYSCDRLITKVTESFDAFNPKIVNGILANDACGTDSDIIYHTLALIVVCAWCKVINGNIVDKNTPLYNAIDASLQLKVLDILNSITMYNLEYIWRKTIFHIRLFARYFGFTDNANGHYIQDLFRIYDDGTKFHTKETVDTMILLSEYVPEFNTLTDENIRYVSLMPKHYQHMLLRKLNLDSPSELLSRAYDMNEFTCYHFIESYYNNDICEMDQTIIDAYDVMFKAAKASPDTPLANIIYDATAPEICKNDVLEIFLKYLYTPIEDDAPIISYPIMSLMNTNSSDELYMALRNCAFYNLSLMNNNPFDRKPERFANQIMFNIKQKQHCIPYHASDVLSEISSPFALVDTAYQWRIDPSAITSYNDEDKWASFGDSLDEIYDNYIGDNASDENDSDDSDDNESAELSEDVDETLAVIRDRIIEHKNALLSRLPADKAEKLELEFAIFSQLPTRDFVDLWSFAIGKVEEELSQMETNENIDIPTPRAITSIICEPDEIADKLMSIQNKKRGDAVIWTNIMAYLIRINDDQNELLNWEIQSTDKRDYILDKIRGLTLDEAMPYIVENVFNNENEIDYDEYDSGEEAYYVDDEDNEFDDLTDENVEESPKEDEVFDEPEEVKPASPTVIDLPDDIKEDTETYHVDIESDESIDDIEEEDDDDEFDDDDEYGEHDLDSFEIGYNTSENDDDESEDFDDDIDEVEDDFEDIPDEDIIDIDEEDLPDEDDELNNLMTSLDEQLEALNTSDDE